MAHSNTVWRLVLVSADDPKLIPHPDKKAAEFSLCSQCVFGNRYVPGDAYIRTYCDKMDVFKCDDADDLVFITDLTIFALEHTLTGRICDLYNLPDITQQ